MIYSGPISGKMLQVIAAHRKTNKFLGITPILDRIMMIQLQTKTHNLNYIHQRKNNKYKMDQKGRNHNNNGRCFIRFPKILHTMGLRE